MYFNSLLFCLVLVATATATAECNADNCLRAIRASAFPTRMGEADCASYFSVTVTPPTSTVTVIGATVTVPPVCGEAPYKRGLGRRNLVEARDTGAVAYPTAIPAYASACSGSVRYSSACSCVGATHATTTAPAPVTTTTTTLTVYSTASVAPPSPYCGSSCYEGYTPECGESYIDVSDGFYVVGTTYDDCATACTNDPFCWGFSFVWTTQCCWITGALYIIEGNPPLPDPSVNSGRRCYE